MVLSKRHLERIAKKNFIIDFELLKALNITKTEAIILDHIAYLNKAYGSISLQITKLTQILQINRQYFYRCLKKLIEKGLLYKDDYGIEITQNYKDIKYKLFCKAHKNKEAKEAIHHIKEHTQATEEKAHTKLHAKKSSHKKENNPKNLLESVLKKETKVSQKATDSILYNTNISLCDKHIKSIYECKSTQNQSKQVGLVALRDMGFSGNEKERGLREYRLEGKIIQSVLFLLKDKIQESKEIVLAQEIKDRIGKEDLDLLFQFINELNATGMFLLPQNKKILFDYISHVVLQKKDLRAMIAYSREHNCLWLCSETESDDSIGRICLKRLYVLLQERVETSKEYTIKQIATRYKDLLLHFLEYRKEKGRSMNEFGLKQLCLTFREIERSGINLITCVNQSIERGYNWVFKPTHRYFRRIVRK